MQVNKSTLYISFDGLLDDLGSAQIVPYCKIISRFSFLTICSLEKSSRMSLSTSLDYSFKKNKISWQFSIFSQNSFAMYRYFYNFFNLFKLVYNSIKKNNPEYIHCRSYIPMIIVCILYPMINQKCKIVFDIRGFWFLERLENPNNKYFSLLLPIFYHIEKFIFSKADYIITLTYSSLDRISSFTSSRKKVFVIPTLSDKTNIDMQKIQKDFDFIYLGSSKRPYRLDMCIDFLSRLNEFSNRRFNMLVLTRSDLKEYKELSRNLGVYNQITFDQVDHKYINNYISRCRCGFVFIDEGISRLAQFPTKVAEILSLGIPICTNYNLPDVAKLLIDFDAGAVIDDIYSKASLEAVINIIDNQQHFNKNAYNLWEQKLSLDFAVKEYAKIYS